MRSLRRRLNSEKFLKKLLGFTNDPIKKVKKKKKEWERIFVNHLSDKGLVATIYKKALATQ